MFAQLVEVDGFDDEPGKPAWGSRHLLSELAECVAKLFGRLGCDGQGFYRVGIIRTEEHAGVGFNGENAVTGLEIEAIGHVLGNGGAD